jgi:uncharacterized small protein (DUF1192 family)
MAVESIKEQLWAALNEKKNCKSKKKVSEGDWYYDFDDPSSGSKGAARKSNTPLWDEYIKDVAEEHPDVKTASDFVKFYGLNEIEEVIAKLKKEGEARKSPRSKKTAQLLQTAHDKMLAKM